MSIKQNKKIETAVEKEYLLDENSPFVLTEAFRNTITNLGFAVPAKENGEGKMICISSALSGEGKSTVSCNLAVTFASVGNKTIIVDCDMRKPKIKSIFKLPKQKGLVDYLSGSATENEIFVKNVRENLDVIPTFKTAPNPVALFAGNMFNDLLDKLKKEYQYIVIDTPPITVVSDGISVGCKTDGIALVVRPDVSDNKSIQSTIQQIEFAGINFLGFIMNGLDKKEHGKKYYKNKYYKYGYAKKED